MRNLLIFVALLATVGCSLTTSAHTVSRNSSQGEAPVDPPRQAGSAYDDYVRGGQLYSWYCGSCHNARPIAERPFSNNEVSLAHMRDQAYLTGKEYRQLMHYLRRWQDVGPPTPEVEPSPRRFTYEQPIRELRTDGKK